MVHDDEEGHLIFKSGDILQNRWDPHLDTLYHHSPPVSRYKIVTELGEGTFGKVVKCEDLQKSKTLAIKIIKNVKKYRDAAKLEINVLSKLAKYDPKVEFYLVKFDVF